MRAVIFIWSQFEELPIKILKNDYVVCADIGLKTALKFGITPNLVLGDFDSFPEGKNFDNCIVLPEEKDDTDTLFAVKKALENNCDEIIVLGGTGGREDHTFANISTLEYIKNKGVNGIIFDRGIRLEILKKESRTLPALNNTVGFSVFAITDTAVVSESGSKYILDNYLMKRDYPIGVSNSTLPNVETVVTVSEGKALLVTIF